jgi:hypothetical protein
MVDWLLGSVLLLLWLHYGKDIGIRDIPFLSPAFADEKLNLDIGFMAFLNPYRIRQGIRQGLHWVQEAWIRCSGAPQRRFHNPAPLQLLNVSFNFDFVNLKDHKLEIFFTATDLKNLPYRITGKCKRKVQMAYCEKFPIWAIYGRDNSLLKIWGKVLFCLSKIGFQIRRFVKERKVNIKVINNF